MNLHFGYAEQPEDHSGGQLGEFTPFQSRIGEYCRDGANWLIGGPAFGSGADDSPADVALPLVLDPIGGTI